MSEPKKLSKNDVQTTIRLPADFLEHLREVAIAEERKLPDVIRRGLMRQYPMPDKKGKK